MLATPTTYLSAMLSYRTSIDYKLFGINPLKAFNKHSLKNYSMP